MNHPYAMSPSEAAKPADSMPLAAAPVPANASTLIYDMEPLSGIPRLSSTAAHSSEGPGDDDDDEDEDRPGGGGSGNIDPDEDEGDADDDEDDDDEDPLWAGVSAREIGFAAVQQPVV